MQGFWFILESVIAGVILVTFLSFVVTTKISPSQEDLSITASKILQDLKKQDVLDRNIDPRNVAAINNQVKVFGYQHAVQICSLKECSGSPPSARNVWVASYILPGRDIYNPTEVRLYIYE